MRQFLDADKNNLLMATIVGKRKRELGLVITAKYSTRTTNQEIITIINKEHLKRKEKYKHFEMKFESVNDYKKKSVFQVKYSFLNIQISTPFRSDFVSNKRPTGAK